MIIKHPIPPFYSESSRILILGSFPSVKSREQMFFYGHKQNRFWRVVSSVFEQAEPQTIEEKKQLLFNHKIALWDVISSCEIIGSADSSIKNVVPNDLNQIIMASKIEKIFINGKTAKKYYDKFIKDTIKIEAICLPSTSAANAKWSIEALVDEWRKIIL